MVYTLISEAIWSIGAHFINVMFAYFKIRNTLMTNEIRTGEALWREDKTSLNNIQVLLHTLD